MSRLLIVLGLITFLQAHSSSANYFIDSHTNCNNVYNNLNSKYVTNLGKKTSTQDCIQACVSYGNNSTANRCDSYTYYSSGTQSGECYAYVNNPLWLPYEQNSVNCGRIIYSCTSEQDCSFNGVCNTNTGNCTCDKAWSGYKCGNLTLLPATKSSGYHMVDNGANTSSWGGSVQYNKDYNVYSMFVAEMQGHCGINSWLVNSQIMYAESSVGNYNSQYLRISRLLVPFAHSPGIIYAPDTKQYVLIHVHNKSNDDTPPCTACTDGTTSSKCNTHNNMTEITSIRYIDSLSDADDITKWSDPIWLQCIGSGDSNLGAQINEDGSLIGMVRKSATKIYLVTASNWKDNTTYKMDSGVNNGLGIFPYLPEDGTEDMYPYKDCKGRWHALFHNRAPDGVQSLCGAHAYSEDGKNWIYGGLAFTNVVKYTDGSRYTFSRRERPHLIFDTSDNCTPVALSSGVQYAHDKDATYTFIQPISS